MVQDAKNLARTAQLLVVEAKHGSGSPPSYPAAWQQLWGAKVDRITINQDTRPSVATIWFPELRWHQAVDINGDTLLQGDMVRICTDQVSSGERTVLFEGFVTGYQSGFSGGSERKGSAYERNAVVCQDYRWLLAATCPIYGQIARGPDDYTNYGQADQAAINSSYIFLSGRRTIFNAGGRPNRDSVLLVSETCSTPIFADSDIAEFWTARDMLRYVLSPYFNLAYQYLPIPDPNQLTGIDHDDWDTVLNHIAVEGLNVIEAVGLICKNIGWGFRQDNSSDGSVEFVFYKIGDASGYTRDSSNATILHKLYAPDVAEDISSAVADGKKILWSADIAEDISSLVNNPWGLGGRHQFEITAELVPAWLDDQLVPDVTEEEGELLTNNLFFTEAELQELADPNTKSYYKYYHPRGSQYRRSVGRKWALNESGKYSDTDTYDRGVSLNFADYVPAEYILDADGDRLFAPFTRRLLPSLTLDKDSLNTVGIRVEFSFDGGQAWQVIPAVISNLESECGIYIDEPSLAELVDKNKGVIKKVKEDEEDTKLVGVQLNYWSSLCGDIINNRSFKDGKWQTRVRVTASIQMDQRLVRQAIPAENASSPFHQTQLYDFSKKYGLTKRTASSSFIPSGLPVWNRDDTNWFDKHLAAIRAANQDMSISGQFTLERLWLGDGVGVPDFAIGDCVEKIEGREYSLAAAFGSGDAARKVYPEIVQIIYLPDRQRMKLITRDLRFAEVTLI